MKTVVVLVLIAMTLPALPLHSETAEQPPPTPAKEQPEVLTRGPIHEAFAEPVDMQIDNGLVAPIQPPPDIVENPPPEKPAGRRFLWVPGYWAWDSERNGYVWVSGCWRAAPPNTYWVPGYWSKIDDGWEWIPGFWSPLASPEHIEYLPAPPAIDDIQPPGPPPTPDNIWVPPCWYWRQGQYVWRSGYWLEAQPDWIWVPSHYVWATRGYVFVAGQWDYPLARRGVMFAPVYFPSPVYEVAGFSYALSVVVDIAMLQFSLFTYPLYTHYYFGDYYDNFYIGVGIFPWYECRHSHTWYDPIYHHNHWQHCKHNPGWEEHERHEYDRRRADRDLRPPRTYREMEERQSRMPESQRRSIQIAEPLSRVAADKRTSLRFQRISADEQQKLTREATKVQRFGEERSRWEAAPARPESVQPRAERKGPVTSPTQERERVTRPTGHDGQVKPSSRPKEPAIPSVGRSPTSVPQRDVNLTRPERVTIPASPIADMQGGAGIFRKGPPSRPAYEQRTGVMNTPRPSMDMPSGISAPKDSSVPRINSAPRGSSAPSGSSAPRDSSAPRGSSAPRDRR